MGKSKKESKKSLDSATKDEEPLTSSTDSAIFDPTLSALFASSAGPVAAASRVTRPPNATNTSRTKPNLATEVAVTSEKTETLEDGISASESGNSSDDGGVSADDSESEEEIETEAQRPRKRRKVDQNEDLESRYLDKLMHEEVQEQKQLRKEGDVPEDSDSDLNSGLEDLSDSDAEIEIKQDKDDSIPKHESQTKQDIEASKMSRTVFLGNVSNTVIKSKTAKKALIKHLQSGIDTKHHEKVESIRFRSTAFASDAGPKRAAYAKKELMEETMKSTNAYVVLSSDAAARKIATRLNGSIVLDRYLRVDNLANPSRVDHKRCIFVGNLSFVDEAVATEETEDGTTKRKKAKEPADVEEGLWRTFGKCGKVESVRVVRDKETRISKGFAYVQFTNENSVEAALLLNEKKFPPMLPRVLRVMRAKREMKSQRRDTNGPRGLSKVAHKDRGADRRSSAGRPGGNVNGARVIFEGHRANSNSLPKGLKKLRKRPAARPENRSSKRAAAFKAGGGKKKRDLGE